MTTATTTAKAAPGFQRMNATLGPTKAEALRQDVLTDQTKSMAAATKTAKVKSETTKPAAPKKAAKSDARKITVLAKTNPHAAGSRRAGWFKQLKTGMTGMRR